LADPVLAISIACCSSWAMIAIVCKPTKLLERVGFTFAAAAYNIVRLRRLLPTTI
jgi:hypothetical protein